MDRKQFAKDITEGLETIIAYGKRPEKQKYIVNLIDSLIEKYPDMQPETYRELLDFKYNAEMKIEEKGGG